MSTERNQTSFLASMADELLSQAGRVRNLIGDAHWLSDGTHKETLLREVLARHMPGGTITARGFVLGSARDQPPSKEIDILVLDTHTEGPVFHHGDLVMGYAHQVLAAISVKSTLRKKDLLDSWKNLQSVRRLSLNANISTGPWCGGFFYEAEQRLRRRPDRLYDDIGVAVRGEPMPSPPLKPGHPYSRGPDMIACAEDLACLLSYPGGEAVEVRAYQCDGLATAAFLGNLFDHIANVRGSASAALAHLISSSEVRTIEPFPTTIEAASRD